MLRDCAKGLCPGVVQSGCAECLPQHGLLRALNEGMWVGGWGSCQGVVLRDHTEGVR